MHDVFFARLEMNLMYQALPAQCEESAAGDEGVTPVGEALDSSVVFRSTFSGLGILTILILTRGDRVRL